LIIPFGQHFTKLNAKTSDLTFSVCPVEVNVEDDLIVDNGIATDALAPRPFPYLS
jgi:hypothetical protein